MPSSFELVLRGPLYSLNNKRSVFYSRREGRVVNVRQTKVREMMDRMAWEAKQQMTVARRKGLRFPLTGDVRLIASIFYRTAASDLDDSMLCNVLQLAGVIESDNQIIQKVLAKHVDAKDPRAVVKIQVKMCADEEWKYNFARICGIES